MGLNTHLASTLPTAPRPSCCECCALLHCYVCEEVAGRHQQAMARLTDLLPCHVCRIYNQNKGDPSVHQHSCVVFTCGAAIVTLLRWLCDVRHKIGHDATSLLRETVVFCLQKGKASRIEQPSSVICDAVRQMLAGHGSPFTVKLVDSTTQLEAPSSELASWLRSPAFSALSFLVHANR